MVQFDTHENESSLLLVGDDANFAFKRFELARKYALRYANTMDKIIAEIHLDPPLLIISSFEVSDGNFFDILDVLNRAQKRIPMLLLLEMPIPHSICVTDSQIRIMDRDSGPSELLSIVQEHIAMERSSLSVSEYVCLIRTFGLSKMLRIFDSTQHTLMGSIVMQDGMIISAKKEGESGLEALRRLLSQSDARVHFHDLVENVVPELPSIWTTRFFPGETCKQKTADCAQFFRDSSVVQVDVENLQGLDEETYSEPGLLESSSESFPNRQIFKPKKIKKSRPLSNRKTRTPSDDILTTLMEPSVEVLMEISIASILTHEYKKAVHALENVLGLEPTHRVARANLERLTTILENKEMS